MSRHRSDVDGIWTKDSHSLRSSQGQRAVSHPSLLAMQRAVWQGVFAMFRGLGGWKRIRKVFEPEVFIAILLLWLSGRLAHSEDGDREFCDKG